MRYEVVLPDNIDHVLVQKARESGADVSELICAAVGRYVDEAVVSQNGQWTAEGERRRRELIDKDIAGIISDEERSELIHLDRLANEHFDRIAPPPTDGAQRLHARLLKKRDNGH
mgnify:CR=1 FL=1